jgi:hypothetical protein
MSVTTVAGCDAALAAPVIGFAGTRRLLRAGACRDQRERGKRRHGRDPQEFHARLHGILRDLADMGKSRLQ